MAALHILGEMAKALTSGREGVSSNAPKITMIQVPKDKIRDIIGTGGKVIREIVEQTGCKIDIDDNGTVKSRRPTTRRRRPRSTRSVASWPSRKWA